MSSPNPMEAPVGLLCSNCLTFLTRKCRGLLRSTPRTALLLISLMWTHSVPLLFDASQSYIPCPNFSHPQLRLTSWWPVQVYQLWEPNQREQKLNYWHPLPPKSVSLAVFSISVKNKSMLPVLWSNSQMQPWLSLAPNIQSIRKTSCLSCRIYLDPQHVCPSLLHAGLYPQQQ